MLEFFRFGIDVWHCVYVPTKNHRPTNATRPKEALGNAYLMFLWTLVFPKPQLVHQDVFYS